jgi:polyhydroxyalkanoate synthesis regulator phasin
LSAVAFDTLKLARDLRERGKLTTEQAEGVAEALSTAFRDEIATKADVQAIRTDQQAIAAAGKADVQAVNSEVQAVKADLRATEKRLDTKIDTVEERLSTKIDAVEERLSTKIDTVEERLNAKFESLRADIARRDDRLTVKLGGMLVVAVAVMASLVKLL